MKFTSTIKDISETTVYNDLEKGTDYNITSIYIDWELYQEVRSWGVKSQSVIVTKAAIGLMDQDDNEIGVEGFQVIVEQPESTTSVFINEVSVDIPSKQILINFLYP